MIVKKILLLIILIPLNLKAQDAPWGISLMQFGTKTCWYETEAAKNGNFNQSNFSIGASGRIQPSFLDLFVYDDQKFRIVDVWGFESGLGYQKYKTFRNDQYYKGEYIAKKVWYDFGFDFGVLAKIRLIPKLDVGVKYVYLSQLNSTFNFTESYRAYGNAFNWGLSARYDKFYADINFIKGKIENPTHLTVFDLKYRYAEKGAWAPYIGLQVGMGITSFDNFGTDFKSTYSRNWVQLSIGKMSNF